MIKELVTYIHNESKFTILLNSIGRILLPPTGGFRMIQVHVGHVGYTGAYVSTIHPCLFLRRLLVKPLDGCHPGLTQPLGKLSRRFRAPKKKKKKKKQPYKSRLPNYKKEST
jgi:hypothetical protein